MWPKRNVENSFSPTGGRRGGRGYGRNQGWDRDGGYQRRGWRSQNNGGPGVGNKRPWSTSTQGESTFGARSKKRLKSNHSNVSLSTLILGNPGDKTGSVPELLCSRFYDCTREVKLGRQAHFLCLNIKRKVYKGIKQRGGQSNKLDAVSIPVPLENIEAVTVLSGMKDFKELLKAHSDRASLGASIARWAKAIEKRTVAHATKQQELQNMPEIEEEPEVPEEEEEQPEENDEEENDSADAAMDVDAETAEMDQEEVERKRVEKKEKARMAAERKKLADAKKKAAKQKLEAERKERALKVKERNLLKTSVENLAAAIEKAKQSLVEDQEKLAQVDDNFGEMLSFFQNETDDAVAQALFLEELKEGMSPIVEEEEVDMENATSGGDANVEGEVQNVEQSDKPDKTEGDKVDDAEMAEPSEAAKDLSTEPSKPDVCSTEAIKSDVCNACGVTGVAKKKFCHECGAKQKDPADLNKVTEVPVWLVVRLKKSLEKFYVSGNNTTICENELLEKSNMIIMEWSSKGDSEDQLNILNTVLAGPWKDIVMKQDLVLKGSSPYNLEKTVQYLVKKHTRQDVWDNTLDECRLCANSVKRVVMERHLTQLCNKREEACQYCEEVHVISGMEKHYESCPKFPVKCPLRCGEQSLERCKVEEHKQTVCRNFEVNCEYKPLGCDVILKRREIPRHMKDLEFEHMEQVKKRMEILSKYLVGKDSALKTVFQPPPAKEEEPMEVEGEEGTESTDQTSMKTEA